MVVEHVTARNLRQVHTELSFSAMLKGLFTTLTRSISFPSSIVYKGLVLMLGQNGYIAAVYILSNKYSIHENAS